MKREMLFISIILVCLHSLTLYSQENVKNNLILIHGIVLDASTQEAINNAHFSVNNLHGGATDMEGKFSLYVYRGDTIRFTYLGYSDLTYFTDTLVASSYVAGIFMKTDTLQIGEVVVFPRMGDLRSEFMNSSSQIPQEMINAQNNVLISTYQGINSTASLGEPDANYDLLKRQQTVDAYEKGGIPSDKMVGLNLLGLIPASIYLLKNGLPEKPPPPAPHVSASEIEKMKRSYRESLRSKNQ